MNYFYEFEKDKDGTLKEPTWKQIEPRALELGDSRLHRKVQGEDLFAREAHSPVPIHLISSMLTTCVIQPEPQSSSKVNRIRIGKHLHILRRSQLCLISFKTVL